MRLGDDGNGLIGGLHADKFCLIMAQPVVRGIKFSLQVGETIPFILALAFVCLRLLS